MLDNIHSCPVCHSRASLCTEKSEHGERTLICCSRCGLQTNFYADKEKAIQKWNSAYNHTMEILKAAYTNYMKPAGQEDETPKPNYKDL